MARKKKEETEIVQDNQITTKLENRTKSFLYAATILGVVAFIFTIWMVIGIPALDATGHPGTDSAGPDDYWGIDIGLHDQAFFAWARPHIRIELITEFQPFEFGWMTVTDPENGTFLRPASIVLLCFDFLVLAILVCAITIEKNYLIKSNKGLFITLIGITCVIFVVITSAILMRYGKFFGLFFNIEVNKYMVNDISNFLLGIETKANMNEFLDAEYTKIGMAAVCTLAVLGGMFSIGTFFGLKNLHKTINSANS